MAHIAEVEVAVVDIAIRANQTCTVIVDEARRAKPSIISLAVGIEYTIVIDTARGPYSICTAVVVNISARRVLAVGTIKYRITDISNITILPYYIYMYITRIRNIRRANILSVGTGHIINIIVVEITRRMYETCITATGSA